MIDFISSIDNSYQRISIDSDPANRLNNNSKRTYSYDEAVAEPEQGTVKLFRISRRGHYNPRVLQALSEALPESLRGLPKAIE